MDLVSYIWMRFLEGCENPFCLYNGKGGPPCADVHGCGDDFGLFCFAFEGCGGGFGIGGGGIEDWAGGGVFMGCHGGGKIITCR